MSVVVPSSTDPHRAPVPETSCRHCGDPCGAGAVVAAAGLFCCVGCESVYAVLHGAGLEGYYACDVPPGVRQRDRVADDDARFAALDDEAVAARFVEFNDGVTARLSFTVPALHCASCLWLIERLWRIAPGVVRAEADLMRTVVRVTYRPAEISARGVAEHLAGIGYAPAIDGERRAGRMPEARRRLYLKIGLAGFAFGNIMLFSIPRYANGAPLDGGFQRLFDTLNVVFATPVLLYSAADYFRASWFALRRRTMTLDVPVALGLAALYGRSLIDIVLGRGEGFLDSFTGLVFFLLIGKLFQQKAFDRIAFDRTYRSFFPLSVRVETPSTGETRLVRLEHVAPGDRLLVRPQEIVPADGVLVDDAGAVDYAFITGEERPVDVARGDVVRAGGRAVSRAIRVDVTSDVSQSRLAGLWNNPIFTQAKPEWLSLVSARFGLWFTVVAMGLAAAGAIAWWPDAGRSLDVATAVLIIACPCALTLSAPITLGTAMGALGQRGLFLKNPAVALALSRIDSILLDKTGTLTRGSEERVTASGLSDLDWRLARRLAAESIHPASRALVGGGAVTGRVTDCREVPGQGIRGRVDGHDVLVGSPAFAAMETGVPVPAGETRIAVAIDGRLRGWVRVDVAARPGIVEAARDLARDHEVALLSGDHGGDADRWRAVFGARMHFRQSPGDKLARVRQEQAAGRHVLMVGDGLNDAGALAAADVGIAVSDETACVVPSCDAVIAGDRVAALPRYLAYARRARHVVILCFAISVAYNVLGLSLALAGRLTPLVTAILMPVSSLTIVGISTGAMRWHARQVLRA